MKVSYLKSTRKPGDVEVKDAIFCLEKIKNGEYKSEIQKVRSEKDNDKRSKLKVKILSGTVWTGRFSYRSIEGFLESSGLAILDFDHLEDASDFRDSLKKDEWIYSAWISPSGDGVKALVRIPIVFSDREYKEYYTAITEHYRNAKADNA